MRDHPDTTTLLATLLDDRGEDAFDPDSPAALAALERILEAAPRPTATRGRRRRPRRLAFAAAALTLALAAAALALPTLLGGSRGGIAQAAVLTRAAAALAQANTILHLQVQTYSATGGGPCIAVGVAPFLACDNGSSADSQTGISADPAADTLTFSYQEWLSPDHSQDHTLYGDGYETVINTGTQEVESYDPAANTVTTLTDDTGVAAPAPDPAQLGGAIGIPSAFDVSDPSYYEELYQEAQAGQQATNGQTTIATQLVGQTTIAGEPVYELRFDFHFTPPANPPAGDIAGDICGTTVCSPPDQETLLYLDSQTFMPVRSVTMLENTTDRPGMPPGTSVLFVAELAVDSLPDTTASESVLAMSAHPGATQITETVAQHRADLEAWLTAQVSANAARAGVKASAERRALARARRSAASARR
jgi:hypothetical protein